MDSSTTSTDGLLKFLAWLDKNKRRVGLIAGGTVVALGLIAAVIYYQGQKETRASEALSNVRKPYNPATPLPPEVASSFLQVARDFEGTKAAGRALLEAASVFYTEGSYTNAEAQYKRFLSEYPDSPFLPQGMLGLASTLEAEGKTSDAMAKYEELRRRFPSDSVIDETKLALARLTEKQNPAEAYKLYTELANGPGSQTGIGSEAGIRMSDLVEKFPDLAKPPTPPAPAPAPTITMSPQKPQVITTKPGSTNPVVMTITNGQPRPVVNKPVPEKISTNAPSSAATSSATPPPPVLKPDTSTNKP